jgi:hypothetical protein
VAKMGVIKAPRVKLTYGFFHTIERTLPIRLIANYAIGCNALEFMAHALLESPALASSFL